MSKVKIRVRTNALGGGGFILTGGIKAHLFEHYMYTKLCEHLPLSLH